ncbi:hypothetical protein OO014_09085 [Intrasporangium calvum]|uniref:Uncharacterized protein n=1 Tax=Intrasporangium calvum TaxID=53358 RepID=A0ABT5GGM4_9MICO|nr:hypothetical protein [Intrasporangium calvum]MDC5697409.1 hypothetical protein [Intrasporangium calvum]
MPTYHLACPYCGGDDLSPFPDPMSAWSCLDCLRILRVELAQPATVSGWGVLRAVQPGATAAA